MPLPALAVCCSGQGTNLQAIIQAIQRRRLRARIAVVISDNPRALALVRAQKHRIPAVVIDRRRFGSRRAFDQAMARAIRASGAHWVVLAGFMRVLSPWFVRQYRWKIFNIHPALLPAFPGIHGAQDALAHGVKVTGVTVHLVDEKVDHGPILLQGVVPIRDSDTEKSLMERVHRLEHRLYPEAIGLMLSGQVRVQGRKVVRRKAKRKQ